LKWLARWFKEKHGLVVELGIQDELEPMPEEVIIQLFQFIREILFNVAKHAGVKTARVKAAQRDGRIFVSIEDEGAGFDPSHLRTEGGNSGGFGLFSINERIGFLGGQMEINSAPGRGSLLNLAIPYPAGALPARSASLDS
jgi:signal transduction histidine kinase